VDYIVEVQYWDWGYSHSLNTQRHSADPYHEFICRSAASCCALGAEDRKGRGVGVADVQHGRSAAEGFRAARFGQTLGIPLDVFPLILQMLVAKQFKFMQMRGTKFRYRSARLHTFRLEMKLTEDDIPPAENAAG
jgi:hypothetical protein